MRQTPNPARHQLSLSLEAQPRHELKEEIREALIEALSELLLEAHGQEMTRDLAVPGESDER